MIPHLVRRKPRTGARKALLGLILSVQLLPAQAEPAPALELSIEDAVFMALRNNRGLRVQQFEPVIAGAFEQIERGAYDPELFAGLGYSEENAEETSRSTGERFTVEGNDAEARAGIRQRLPTGTEIEASVREDRSISDRAPEQQSARFGLTVTQQLLRGFGPAVNLAAIRAAALDSRASRYELLGYTEALVADVETAYWRYVSARESIAVFESSLEVADTQLEEIDSRIEVGDLPKNEAAAARAERAQRQQDLIDAQSELNDRRYTLVRLISPGLSESRIDALVATSQPGASEPEPLPDPAERTRLALNSRPEIEQARLLLDRKELETVVTRNGRLPRLELFINLGKSGYADTFRDSFRNSDGPSYDVTVGIEFSQALGNRSARAEDIIARANRDQAEEALANLRDLIRFDVLTALNELDRARRQIAASTETRHFREQTVQAERDRFEVGSSTALDLARAERDLVQSRITEIEARVAYRIARVQLYLAEGSLLERRGLAAVAAFEN